MRKLFGFILLVCISSASWGLEFPGRPIAYYSKSAKQFHVIFGDTLYTTGIYKEEWQRIKLNYPEGMNFASFHDNYVPLSNSQSDFFVIGGCGIVYQLKGDRIERIDKSFPHKNQYGGSYLVIRDTLSVFFGYGFFETTQVGTYYDWDTQGWYMRTYSGMQVPRWESSPTVVNGDFLTFLGGKIRTPYKEYQDNSVYQLDTRNWSWKKLGDLSKNWIKWTKGLQRFESNGHLWLKAGDGYLAQVDLENNSVHMMKAEKNFLIQNIVQQDRQILLSVLDHNFANCEIKIIPVDSYFNGNIEHIQLMSDQTERSYIQWQSFIIPSLLLIFAIGYLWQRKLERRKEANVIANEEVQNLESDLEKEKQQEEEILSRHAGEVVWVLTELEQSLLEFLILKRAEGVEMNELNPFFDYGQPNFDTLKKRRDFK